MRYGAFSHVKQRWSILLTSVGASAWGVNLPAHFVIVKGTEYYDGKTNRYVDYPLTDVLQMIGRAGRPGFDDRGSAVVMVAEDKKNFYKVRRRLVRFRPGCVPN